MTIERNQCYVVPSAVVEAITTFLRGQAFDIIHYVGYADEGLIRSLIREARYSISLMDYWDRYHREAHFFNDDGLDLSDLVVPDWLDGIATYFDGSPPHQVLLQDIPWLEGQLDRLMPRNDTEPRGRQMTASSGGRRGNAVTLGGASSRPACIILFGQAQLDTCHPSYEWQDFRGTRIGLRRSVPRRAPSSLQGSLF